MPYQPSLLNNIKLRLRCCGLINFIEEISFHYESRQ